jgi:hypothetical protein
MRQAILRLEEVAEEPAEALTDERQPVPGAAMVAAAAWRSAAVDAVEPAVKPEATMPAAPRLKTSG